MGRQDEIVAERLKKLKELRERGVNPYPNKFEKTHSSAQLQTEHAKLKNEAYTKEKVSVAGRVLQVRDMGKIAFGTLYDGEGTIQIVLQEKETHDDVREFFKKFVDGGDFVGVEGLVFRTKRGELSILVKKLELLTKSMLPLPDKFHGISDDEERLRKRYLEIITNAETREVFKRKAKFWGTMRTFLQQRDFLEVETPVLENAAGGASATPFATHHNALDLDVYLRISMGELWQKKLMVAGYPRTFEIGRQFRNEGMDAEHLQDYTQMEFYWGYANYEDGMKLVEEMYKTLAKDVYGKTKFHYNGHDFDIGKKWGVIDYAETIKKDLKIDVFIASKQDMEKKLRELKQEFAPNLERGRLMDLLWKVCRKKIAGPAFLTGQPVEVSPLAKRDPRDARKVEQFQVILAGSEMGNGYSELNDPFDQDERFKEQRRMKEAGDTEAQEHDETFVEALKYGMPPTCGFGVSERLFAVFENKPLRECVIFPLMRPTHGSEEEKEVGKSKETMVATVVINSSAKMEPWQAMNTVAHLNAAFGARRGRGLFLQDKITTEDQHTIHLNIQHAIMIKEGSKDDIKKLLGEAHNNELEIAEFTREMMETTDDKKVIERTGRKKLHEVEHLGVLVFGKRSTVDKLTEKFKLFKHL